MKQKLRVQSTVIDWVEKTMEITDADGRKHIVPLDLEIQVSMIGYPDRQTKTMAAKDLGPYLSQGFVIEQIAYEEKEA